MRQENDVIYKSLALQRMHENIVAVAIPPMDLNEEVVQKVSHAKVAFEHY